ncbi:MULTISPECIES: tetratricopeptide repeat protein [Marinobacter]|uniref:tetratricopeptide repeat protein n=1 Tax=Marinobacter TaxID=2742 RepID=UPI001B14EE4F|nr:tetratricopeptide repeat protein [Marinobacter sp.]MBO6813038.1 tetratricopeptide repeat protein [Marinobacter sp.]MBO6873086.1 tetratricopeptide repeat protein [Marinobacter sp.]
MKTRNQTLRVLPRLLLFSALLGPLPLLVGCNNQPDSSEAMSHISRADTYAEQGQYRSALVEVKNAIQADPNNVSHIVRLAEIYQSIGAYEQASDLLEPWLSDHSGNVALPLAKAYVEQGKQLSALETLEKFSADSSEGRLQAALIRAEALRLAGEKAEALALFRNLTDSNGTNLRAIVGLARSHLDLNQTFQAIQALDEWTTRNGQEPEVLYWKGVAQYRENQLEAASATLTDAVGVLPTSDVFLPIRRDTLSSLSRVLTEQGRITEAQVYNRILAENLNTGTKEQGEAAIAAIKDGNIDEAKTILRDMLKLDPDNEQVALMLGALSAGTGELDEGTRLLMENLDPETTPTQFIRAATMAQIDAGDREEALKTLDRAIKARPNDNELLAMHGILALSLPEYQDAGVASLSKAISNEPNRVRLRLALAQYHIRNDQPEQALGQLRMAFTSDPSEWNTTGTYLNLLIQQGEAEEAMEIRDSLLNGYGEEPSAVLLASMADAQLGNTEAAKKRLQTLVQESPELQAPKVALAMLYQQTGEPEQAVEMFIDAARITPDAIQPLQQAGRIFAQNHTVNEVEQWLNKVGQDHPELRMNTSTLAALIKIRQGELAEARGVLDEWQATGSEAVRRATGQLLGAEAQKAANSGDYAAARAKAGEAIALQPENLSYALLPVGIYQKEGKLDEALKALDAVEDTFGSDTAVVLSRAALLRQKEGDGAAYQYLLAQWRSTQDIGLMPSLLGLAKTAEPEAQGELTDSWLSVAPNSSAAHMARADWLMANQQEIVAANHYEQVITRQPNNIAALNNLAWLLREDNPERAMELAGRARDLAPDNAAVLDTYGWILHLSGKHAEAKEVIERALALAPDNSEIRAHLETVNQAM